jgi:apolipoprotein N-acyltransferase
MARYAHPSLAALLAGAIAVFGFAPFDIYPLPVIAFAVLIALWRRAQGARTAAWLGFLFGFGCFVSGVSWVYVSMHDFGAMPAWLAAALTLLLCAYMALFPALTGWLYHRLGTSSLLATLAALPALWTLTEWLRGWLFTGFPWLAVGYSQVPASMLAGYLPVIGVYGVTLVVILSAALLNVLWVNVRDQRNRKNPGPLLSMFNRVALFGLLAIWTGGYVLSQLNWTVPVGRPVSVALIQGNIAQDLKWREDRVQATLVSYRELVEASDAKLIVLPETALPLFLHSVPPHYLDVLAAHAKKNGGDILIGAPERGAGREYFNSVVSIGSAPQQFYRKSHLVPFGEFVPLKLLFGWFLDVAQIPLADFSRGDAHQQPLAVAGEQVAVNICYEDAFGAEIARQLPQATLLVNVSNVAWFGRSIAPQQHLQISQARAIETGRTMLRATNTGMTAIIDPHGTVQAVAPEFATAVLRGEVQGYSGATPYVVWNDLPVLAAALLMVALAWWRRPRRARPA